jgi:hypothetical protein
LGKQISLALSVLIVLSTLLGSILQPTAAQEIPTIAAQAELSPTVPSEPLATVEAMTAAESPTATEMAEPSPTQESATSTAEDPTVLPTEVASTATAVDTVAPPTSTATPDFQAAETATLQVRTVDHTGAPVLNVMYRAYQKNEEGWYLGNPEYSWDGEEPDGISLFPPLLAGVTIALLPYSTPAGYLGPTDEITVVTLDPGETRTVEVVMPLGGTVIVHGVDQNGDPRSDGCYTLYEDLSGVRGEAKGFSCDKYNSPPNEGTTVINGLPAGSYLIAPHSDSPYYSGGPDVPASVELGGTVEITATFIPAGTIVIHKRTADNQSLPGSCFIVFRDEGNGAHNNSGIGGGCDHQDGADDGEITFPAPLGDIVIAEDQVPVGYLAADELLVHLESGETQTFTVVDPLASALMVSVTDLWSHPIVEQTCLRLNADAGGGTPGDYYGEECTNFLPERHLVKFDLLPPGNYVLTLVTANKPGYYRDDPLLVSLGLSETRTVKFKLNGSPPTLKTGPYLGTLSQTEALIHWETDQPTVGSIRYGLSENFGRNAGPSASEQRVHRLLLTGLNAGRTYYFQLKNTNANGIVQSETYYFRTPSSSATASLVITKTNSEGSVRLGGACFVVHKDAGNGVLGSGVGGGCDKFDASPNDGRITVTGLGAGAYVLVETLSPSGYSLAKNTRFSVSAGQIKRLTVKDSRGGAVLTVSTEGFTGSSDRPPVPGACYAIYAGIEGRVGPRVSHNCDAYDGLDGKTRLGALRAGQYFLEITEVPLGYLPAGLQQYWQIDIRSGQRAASYLDILPPETYPENIIIRSANSDGTLLPGACFALYQAVSGPDPLIADACDEDDGHYDGRTVFKNMPGIRYTAVEFFAPPGYQVGARVSFTKTDGVLRTVTIVQTPGNVKVTVTTVKGSTTTKLPGACYGLFRSGGYQEFVTGACDTNGDGRVEMPGIPPGEYILAQTQTPSGYRTPPARTITVGSRSLSFTFKTYPG